MDSGKRGFAMRVRFQRALSSEYRHLGLAAPGFARTFRPGQFVMLRSPRTLDPLIGRAFSIYRIAEGADPTLEILYKTMGKGTACLAQMEVGEPVDVLGPLGNGFEVPPEEGTTVLVAGGIGVPPIAALAERLAARGPRRPHVFLGGKTSADILCAKEFDAAGAILHITTEDGSAGTAGMITELLEPFLRAGPPGPIGVYACGPPGMLLAVAWLTESLDLRCQVSVEASMACGFGACMGCAIESRSQGPAATYKLVCQDGPVFDSRELVWKKS
jgi:dihydroorotate dehydrogenase electron transfer subunit